MTRTLAAFIALTAFSTPAIAADVEAGEKEFNKCKSCHMIVADDGTEIVTGGKTGPNLYNVVGRTAGTMDFRYGDDLVAAGEAGLVWDEANLTEYMQDPRAFLRTYLDDSGAKSKMTFKLRKGAEDVAAYLASVGGGAS